MKPPPARDPPVKATTVATAGSLFTIYVMRVSLSCMSVKEMLWSARRPPIRPPVSCCGKKPLGATAIR